MSRRILKSKIVKVNLPDQQSPTIENILVEEPLTIRIRGEKHRTSQVFTTTMRTPGDDFDLSKGLLWHEGAIQKASDILQIQYCTRNLGKQDYNTLSVILRHSPTLPARTQIAQSGCGVCGLSSLEHHQQLLVACPFQPAPLDPKACLRWLCGLDHAPLFHQTGGCHTAGWAYRNDQSLQHLYEDVGRHNAVDKLVGANLANPGFLDDWNKILFLSGRIGYELVVKAIRSRFSGIVAVGAPSSQALALCRTHNIQLVGFAKKNKLNIYN